MTDEENEELWRSRVIRYRKTANKIVDESCSDEMKEELDCRIQAFYEDKSDPEELEEVFETVDAFFDFIRHAENVSQDTQWAPLDRRAALKDFKWGLEVCLKLGVYRPISEEEIKGTFSTKRINKNVSYPKINGVRHICEEPWQCFLESLI